MKSFCKGLGLGLGIAAHTVIVFVGGVISGSILMEWNRTKEELKEKTE